MPVSQFFGQNCFIKIDRPTDEFLVFFCHFLSFLPPKQQTGLHKNLAKKIIEGISYYKLWICEEDQEIRPILKALVLNMVLLQSFLSAPVKCVTSQSWNPETWKSCLTCLSCIAHGCLEHIHSLTKSFQSQIINIS